MHAQRFVARFLPEPPKGDALLCAFRGADVLVSQRDGGVRLPRTGEVAEMGLPIVRSQYLGELDGGACVSAELEDGAADVEGYGYLSLRAAYGKLDPAEFHLAGFGYQIQYWDRNYRFCPGCGGPTSLKVDERAKRCEPCGRDFFPPVVPAIIVRVTRGDEILMTRQVRFPKGLYGLVAGFLEPGETLEACVAREVKEETGLVVKGVRYFGSQPWPFPHQVMVGFSAEHASGEIVVDTSELEDARWFHREAMPLLPPPLSIARALVDDWMAQGRS